MCTLYKKEAIRRGIRFSDVSYRIIYALLPGGLNFHGKVEISFTYWEELAEDEEETEWCFIDYDGHSVHSMTTNGSPNDDVIFENSRIYLNKDLLKVQE